jgi:hypothetical protein
LCAGLALLGVDVSVHDSIPNHGIDAGLHLIQLHGAPHSRATDTAFLDAMSASAFQCPIVVLLHRPDELVLEPLGSRLAFALTRLMPGSTLVFLGDAHIDDAFFTRHSHLRRMVIAHGFFDHRLPVHALTCDRVVVGTHCNFGEIRQIEHVVQLLASVFQHSQPHHVIGVIGGSPLTEVNVQHVESVLDQLQVHAAVICGSVQHTPLDQHCILIQPTGGDFVEAEPIFNTQLFHLNGSVRTGESSGAAHTRANIPVIFELNGTDRAEDLRVIRVPYASHLQASTADFDSAGKEISALISSGDYKSMLLHNAAQAAKFSPKFIAQQYWNLLNATIAS